MSKQNEKDPDNVCHERTTSLPFGLGHTIHKTIVEKGGNTYTGHGWTEEEANKKAGEKYNKGDKDK